MKIRTTLVSFSLIAAAILFVGLASNEATDAATPAPSKSGSTFEQRLAQRKAERNIKLDERDSKRLTSTCVRAQSKIRELQQKTSPILDNRREVYLKIDAKLWVVIGRLRLAERDTYSLEKLRAAYSSSISRFFTTADNYDQTLNDLAVINCQSDIVGFKALLETARIYHKDLRKQSANIRSQVVNDIKADLTQHTSEMQPKPSTEGEEQ